MKYQGYHIGNALQRSYREHEFILKNALESAAYYKASQGKPISDITSQLPALEAGKVAA